MQEIKRFIICLLFSINHISFGQVRENKNNEEIIISGIIIPKNTGAKEEFLTVPQSNCTAILKTRDGKVYRHVNGRINMKTGDFIFSVNQQEFICAVPLMQIVFDSCYKQFAGAVFESGYPSIDKQNNKSFYRILTEGKATLLKYYTVEWPDDQPYNIGGPSNARNVEHYYLYMDWQIFRLNRNNNNLAKLLAVPSGYLSENKLNPKNENDAIKLVAYYNSLSR